jgi:hypothetical protein
MKKKLAAAEKSTKDDAVGSSVVPGPCGAAGEGFSIIDGQEFVRIADCDRIPPFLMSIVSDSDLWMYISSSGGLTCGRVDEDHSLFPYDTDDLLHLAAGATGPVTLLRVETDNSPAQLWEPFTDHLKPATAHRNLYKSVLGNSIVFEEVRPGLGLTFRYQWSSSVTYGFVRIATLQRHAGAPPAKIEVLDGLLNILPAGVDWFGTHRFSCLMNAYMRCEADPATHLGIYAMTAMPIDRAEPAEALRASVAWSLGLEPAAVVLGPDQLRTFREGGAATGQNLLKGRRGAYLVASEFVLADGQEKTWLVGADVNQGQADVVRLREELRAPATLEKKIRESIAAGSANLTRIVASADGLQATADRRTTAHHFSNVLFNAMRGGVFAHNYDLPGEDFAAFVRQRNHATYAAHKAYLDALAGPVNYQRLLEDLEKRGDADLLRLGQEYLPLTFSRRHGDPSRPWNRFAIHVRRPDGSRILAYQGNWRDIFQNWEALTLSFPGFIESILAKFVNASTLDGFNPYRMSQAGIDWEAPEVGQPWANLGYWGDHQIIYLLRFLEASRRYHPGALERMLDRDLYTYANVPYRLKPYEAIVQDPHATIVFDFDAAKVVDRRVADMGSDGRLVLDSAGRVVHVSLAEKLLVPALAKLSNLVVDGGIWMNTQRPEWNDANNALVGNGISMVTLAHLRRYLTFLITMIEGLGDRTVVLSTEVAAWCDRLAAVLTQHRGLLAAATVSDVDRKTVLDQLGQAFSDYREQVYRAGLSGRAPYALSRIADLSRTAIEYLDHALKANRRPDGLVHSYNLINLSADGTRASVDYLYEMLEGQVAALSSGAITAEEAADLLKALRDSRMYRPDQDTFLLYPDRPLPAFLDKGAIPAADVQASPLLAALVKAGDATVVVRDVTGQCRFASDFRNKKDLRAALDALAKSDRWRDLAAAHSPAVMETFERIFNHRAFTGRSGTMYGYEGLGCIYWHMVAKVLVAAQECFFAAVQAGRPQPVVKALGRAYFQVRAGLGFTKSAAVFGAIPLDPYSHTPGHAGAQQPGMTGQVKEEILTRMGELGVVVEGGEIAFRPLLLGRDEFLRESYAWTYIDIEGKSRPLPLEPRTLAFTFCQVPIVYALVTGPARVVVIPVKGSLGEIAGNRLDAATSASLFNRTGEIREIHVSVPEATLWVG